jgi:hypothetical protein
MALFPSHPLLDKIGRRRHAAAVKVNTMVA